MKAKNKVFNYNTFKVVDVFCPEDIEQVRKKYEEKGYEVSEDQDGDLVIESDSWD